MSSQNPQYETIDSVAKPVTLLLKGDSGAGKTYKAAQFPRPVIWNFDNNLSGLRKLPQEIRSGVRIKDPRKNKEGKQVSDIEVWKNFTDQLEEVSADSSVGTIVIDSLTTMAEVLMDKILKNADPGTRVEIQHWGDFSRYMKWLGEHLLCANDLDKHVVFLAHEQIVQEKIGNVLGSVKYLLSVGGQSKTNFGLYFTDEWRAYTKPRADGDVDYMIRTLPTPYHTAKKSLDLKPDFKWDDEKNNIMKQLEAGLPVKK